MKCPHGPSRMITCKAGTGLNDDEGRVEVKDKGVGVDGGKGKGKVVGKDVAKLLLRREFVSSNSFSARRIERSNKPSLYVPLES